MHVVITRYGPDGPPVPWRVSLSLLHFSFIHSILVGDCHLLGVDLALEVSTDQHKHRLDSSSSSALCWWDVVQSPVASAPPESGLEMLHHGPLCRAAEPPGVYQAHQVTPAPRQEETENAQVW